MSSELSLAAACFPTGFYEDDQLRSRFLHRLFLQAETPVQARSTKSCTIPKVLVRFWHDAEDIPADVQDCLRSWDVLKKDGFEVALYDDISAAAYIAQKYGSEHVAAFAECGHPAMRSDYFRLCYILSSGGFYVDADDVVTEGLWSLLYGDDRLKLQPLCYDVPSGTMVEGEELWDPNSPDAGRIYYINNNPLVAPPGHPVLQRALERATIALLNSSSRRDIQSTTGPGNLTAMLAAHAHELAIAGHAPDFELLGCWHRVARTQWDLSYRADERNWRNVDWG